MTLHSVIQSDASAVFCNANDFAESVVYTSSTGSSRTIQAVVNRDGYQTDSREEDSEVFEVHIVNSSTLGVASSAIKPGTDTLTFAKRVGETATAQTIVRLLSHDEGMLVVECR